MKSLAHIFPQSIRHYIETLPATILNQLEEIRIRQDRPLEIVTSNTRGFVHRTTNGLTTKVQEAYHPNRQDCKKLMNLISQHSLYAMEEELRRGYITIVGGHRIGICGKVIVENGKVRVIRDIASFNVRIARAVTGVGERIVPFILHEGKIENVLIVSPPQCGKTTLIRDLARLASTGTRSTPSYKVGIVDERSEIAGCLNGVPQHDVGPRTDVLDACPKAEGMMMMIRSMSPEIIIVDELGREEDSQAIFEAIYAGVHLFATTHGYSLNDLEQRPTLSRLMKEKVFSRIFLLSRRTGPGTVEAIYDRSLRRLEPTVVRNA